MANDVTNDDEIENAGSAGFKIGGFILLFFAIFIGPGIAFLIWWTNFIPVSEWWSVSLPSGRRLSMSLVFILGPEILLWLGLVWSSGPKRAFKAAFMLGFMNSIFIAIGVFVSSAPFVDQINACYSTSQHEEAVVMEHAEYCRRHAGSALPSCNLAAGLKFTGALANLDGRFITEEDIYYSKFVQFMGKTVSVEYRQSPFGISIFKVANMGAVPKCILPSMLKPYLVD